MTRVYRTQPEYEQSLITRFLRDLGYRISGPKWQDKPDALVTVSKGKIRKRVAIEHTDYFNDTEAGRRSPLTVYDEFWRIAQESLVRRISHRKHLTGIFARVRLRKNLSKPKDRTELARQLAKELVEFVESHPVKRLEHVVWRACDFNNLPTVRSLIDFVLLSRWTNDAVFVSRCSWVCDNIATGGVCLNMRYIKTAIRIKNKKARRYEWEDADEKWLLIAASGAILSNHAGPPDPNESWDDATLKELCRNSLFDKIIFWESVRHWYKWLKPDRGLVQYRPGGPGCT